MTPLKIRDIVTFYHSDLTQCGVLPQRIDVDRTFASLSHAESLAHALHLCNGILSNGAAYDWGKLNRHLTALQMCQSYADRHTLREMMEMNRPKQ